MRDRRAPTEPPSRSASAADAAAMMAAAPCGRLRSLLARGGRLLQPFGLVFIPMVEPSKRLPLRASVDVTLLPYRAGGSVSDGGGPSTS